MPDFAAHPYGNPPILIGQRRLEWHEFMHYMYLPIFIRGVGNAIPKRLEFAEGLIREAIRYEVDVLDHDWAYIYVTARRGFATPGNPLNRPGWHSDGFGTHDINYVWTDRYPTLFAVQDFVDISEDHVESARQFEEQVRLDAVRVYEDNVLMRLDPTVIHSAPEIPAPGGVRSFLKVSFSNERYNLLGNSHNYELDYDWPMFDREALRNDPAHAESDSAPDPM